MRKKILILIIISAFIFILDWFNFLNPVKNIAEKIFAMPVLYVTSGIVNGAGEKFRVLTFWKSGEERIKNLEQKNWELASITAKNTELMAENDLLKKQLNISLSKNLTKVEANVLSITGEMVIDAGANSRVRTGATVFYLDIYIGTISKVLPNRSFVKLPTNSTSEVLVKAGNVRGVLNGQYNNSMVMTKISQEEMVLKDDPVFTTGEGEAGLANLLVGRAGSIKSKESDIFKVVEIIPPLDYKKLDKVFVVIE